MITYVFLQSFLNAIKHVMMPSRHALLRLSPGSIEATLTNQLCLALLCLTLQSFPLPILALPTLSIRFASDCYATDMHAKRSTTKSCTTKMRCHQTVSTLDNKIIIIQFNFRWKRSLSDLSDCNYTNINTNDA